MTAQVAPREPDTCSVPYRGRFDEGGPGRLVRTSVVLRYTQDLAGRGRAACRVTDAEGMDLLRARLELFARG